MGLQNPHRKEYAMDNVFSSHMVNANCDMSDMMLKKHKYNWMILDDGLKTFPTLVTWGCHCQIFVVTCCDLKGCNEKPSLIRCPPSFCRFFFVSCVFVFFHCFFHSLLELLSHCMDGARVGKSPGCSCSFEIELVPVAGRRFEPSRPPNSRS